jgi:hypothetical protein
MDGGPISILRGVNVHIERVRSTIRTFLMRDIPRGTLSAAAGVSHALSGHSQNELLIPRQSALIRPPGAHTDDEPPEGGGVPVWQNSAAAIRSWT